MADSEPVKLGRFGHHADPGIDYYIEARLTFCSSRRTGTGAEKRTGGAADPPLSGKQHAFIISDEVPYVPDPNANRCFVCDKVFRDGDLEIDDREGSMMHATCAGGDRDGYTSCVKNGGPLEPGQPLPRPSIYRADLRAPFEWASDEQFDNLNVDFFAEQMKVKLGQKRDEGYGGWDDPKRCTPEHLSYLLHQHVEKGDPLDVANFCMMLAMRGLRIAPRPAEPQPVVKLPDWWRPDMELETAIDLFIRTKADFDALNDIAEAMLMWQRAIIQHLPDPDDGPYHNTGLITACADLVVRSVEAHRAAKAAATPLTPAQTEPEA